MICAVSDFFFLGMSDGRGKDEFLGTFLLNAAKFVYLCIALHGFDKLSCLLIHTLFALYIEK